MADQNVNQAESGNDFKRWVIREKEQQVEQLKNHLQTIEGEIDWGKQKDRLVLHLVSPNRKIQLFDVAFMSRETFVKLYMNEIKERIAKLESEIIDMLK